MANGPIVGPRQTQEVSMTSTPTLDGSQVTALSPAPRRRPWLSVAAAVGAALGGFALGLALAPDTVVQSQVGTQAPAAVAVVPDSPLSADAAERWGAPTLLETQTVTRPTSADAAESWWQACTQGLPSSTDARERLAATCW
jgi:hypothetical protein